MLTDCCTKTGALSFRQAGQINVVDYLERIAAQKDGLIFQEHIKQHESLSALSRASVNTLRVLTTLTESGDVEFPAVILKMGRNSSLVDNVGSGGIAAHLNLESGMLGQGFVWPGIQEYDTHPDTGVPIRGFIVPFWREALALAALAHRNLTSARSLGWDLAITEAGPVLVEMNSFVAIPVYQRQGRSVRKGLFGELLREN